MKTIVKLAIDVEIMHRDREGHGSSKAYEQKRIRSRVQDSSEGRQKVKLNGALPSTRERQWQHVQGLRLRFSL